MTKPSKATLPYLVFLFLFSEYIRFSKKKKKIYDANKWIGLSELP